MKASLEDISSVKKKLIIELESKEVDKGGLQGTGKEGQSTRVQAWKGPQKNP